MRMAATIFVKITLRVLYRSIILYKKIKTSMTLLNLRVVDTTSYFKIALYLNTCKYRPVKLSKHCILVLPLKADA